VVTNSTLKKKTHQLTTEADVKDVTANDIIMCVCIGIVEEDALKGMKVPK